MVNGDAVNSKIESLKSPEMGSKNSCALRVFMINSIHLKDRGERCEYASFMTKKPTASLQMSS